MRSEGFAMLRERLNVIRKFTVLTATACAAIAAVTSAYAQNYPNRPVKIVVPTPAGGPVDVMGRLVASQISPLLGQAAFIDNRGGAANTLGSAEVARATPDGYTLL